MKKIFEAVGRQYGDAEDDKYTITGWHADPFKSRDIIKKESKRKRYNTRGFAKECKLTSKRKEKRPDSDDNIED